MGYNQPQYADSGGGLSAHLEGVVPLILILVVGLLVAVNLNVVDIGGLPFSDSQSSILIVGNPSAETVNALQSFDARGMNISTTTLGNVNSILPGTLAGFDTIILEGNQFLGRTARSEVLKFVNKGGRLVVVKNAATRVEDDASILGWEYIFGDTMPVACAPFVHGDSGSCKTVLTVEGKFLPAGQTSHPILQGVKVYPQTGFDTWQVLDVTPLETPIAFIQTAENNLYPAIVVRQNVFGGKIIYFNYSPGKANMTGVFLNALEWLN